MEALLLFSIAAVAIGAILAWFHRRTFWNLCIKTAAATLALLAIAMLILNGPPEHYSPKYLLQGFAYFVYPYVIFLLVPGVATAGLSLFIRRKLRPKSASE
ncbi:MAG TPA: hypothetical protein VNO52_06560, partial [Methylomirabilota bacterium]|nr:hypothetical protein [Methylomirabilota bacterium]